MLVLIDKYGCSGFKLTKHSTPYLVIGMVIIRDFAIAEKMANTINALKKSLNINPEFKFGKASLKVKELFLDSICDFDFEIRVIIADKIGISNLELKHNSDNFYNYLIATLIKNNEDILSNASLKINNHVDRKFRDCLQKNLQEQAKSLMIKKFKFSNSENDALIQLADMLIGMISNNYTNESVNSYKLFNKLMANNKIKSIWKLRESS
ncbi:MAG: DUF3800 domain-containing protein [Gammaproteobacteria bacterium]